MSINMHGKKCYQVIEAYNHFEDVSKIENLSMWISAQETCFSYMEHMWNFSFSNPEQYCYLKYVPKLFLSANRGI